MIWAVTQHYLFALLWCLPLIACFGILLTTSYYRKADSSIRFGWWGAFSVLCLGLQGLSHFYADANGLGF